MKDKLRDKYVQAFYFDRLRDDWHQFTQDTKFAKDYVAQIDEVLIRCSTFGNKGAPKSFPDLGLVLEKTYTIVGSRNYQT